MDYMAHGFWSYIFFNKIKKPLLAVVFGLMPDTISWLPYAIYRLATQGGFGKPVVSEIPQWTFTLYNMSHSLVVVAAAIILIFIIFRKVPIYIFAWPIAIVIDLLTHTRDFLPTPFLWPISKWRFPGISWGSWQFIAINYVLITILMILIVYKKRKGKF